MSTPEEHRARMTSEAYKAHRRHRYATDPEYRERHRRQSREGVQRLRERNGTAAAYDQRYQAWVERQGSDLCAICGQQERRLTNSDGSIRRLAIDHDHATGYERGLLCSACNIMLGNADDRPELLEAAAAYLRKHFAAQHNNDGQEAERER